MKQRHLSDIYTGPEGEMAATKTWVLSFLVLEVTTVLGMYVPSLCLLPKLLLATVNSISVLGPNYLCVSLD